MALNLSASTLSAPEEVVRAFDAAWDRLGRTGTWLTGAERAAVAAETRHSADCDACGELKTALSPYDREYSHDALGELSDPMIDLIHRLVNDQGRLTPAWFESLVAQGLSEGAYVETVSIVAHVRAIDTYHRGLGLNPPELPKAKAGEPSREIPAGAERRIAWVKTVRPQEATGRLAEAWFPGGETVYIPRVHQSMSYVPEETIAFRDMCEPLYLKGQDIMDFTSSRSLSRPQIELLAARTSAMNECFY